MNENRLRKRGNGSEDSLSNQGWSLPSPWGAQIWRGRRTATTSGVVERDDLEVEECQQGEGRPDRGKEGHRGIGTREGCQEGGEPLSVEQSSPHCSAKKNQRRREPGRGGWSSIDGDLLPRTWWGSPLDPDLHASQELDHEWIRRGGGRSKWHNARARPTRESRGPICMTDRRGPRKGPEKEGGSSRVGQV